MVVEADIFADGHDLLSARGEIPPAERPTMDANRRWNLGERPWRGEFAVTKLGNYYTIEAWVDHFKSWRKELRKKVAAGQNISRELQAGREIDPGGGRNARRPGSEQLLGLGG